MWYGDIKKLIENVLKTVISDIAKSRDLSEIQKLEFTYDANGKLQSIKFYSTKDLIFTLLFTWNDDGTLGKIERV